jgi:hypothetical protein
MKNSIPLLRVLSQAQKVEDIRILKGLASQIGMFRWQPIRKVGHRPALALMQAHLDLHN